MKFSPVVAVLSITCLVACSGGGNTTSTPTPQPAKAPEVNQPKVFSGTLVPKSQYGTSLYIKNGLYASTLGLPVHTFNEVSPAARTGNYSTTNTQEAGVDEADRIEYDGQYLYLAQPPVWPAKGDEAKPSVRVLQRQQDFSLKEVAKQFLGEGHTEINGMYLAQQRLSVLHSNFPVIAFAELFAPRQMGPGEVNLSIYDSSQPASLSSSAHIKLDGWLVSSRRIGQYLYLVTGTSPKVEGLVYGDDSNETRLKNYRLIQQLDIESLMPKITVNGQSRALHQSKECLSPSLAGALDGGKEILSVTRINTLAPSEIDSLCLLGQASNLYMSTENLYLTGSADNSTVVHKLSLSESLAYQASGKVKGILGWQANPQLRLDEEQGYLRIVTSDYKDKPTHSLSVLKQQGRFLNIVASLPNEQQPEPIGKPEEDIYAVRFIGDKGYIVTFERTDPLYVLDLADPMQPQIRGSLEIPGFSSYLHPLENGFVLGVGQEVKLEDLPRGQGEDVVTMPVRQGVKVSLFDATDPSNPKEISTLVKEKGYTPVEFDYKALSVLKNGEQYQFAMPIEQWLKCDETCIASSYRNQHSLMMIDVSAVPGSGVMNELRQWTVKSDQKYVFGGLDRSVIHGEHVYYVHGNQVWHSLWKDKDSAPVDGPY